jgi:enamine deaminase RidA (YjgF/YER057c/UK114 family)
MEPIFGFSRAVVAGQNIHVAGTAPIPRDGDLPDGAYDQMRLCLEIVGEALGRAGAGFEDVVRTRMFIVHAEDWPEIARAHGEVFADIRPATAMLEVSALLDPRMMVEIEADAFIGG